MIGGYRRETTGRPNLGSLLIGYFDRGKLVYAGSVGTGWSVQLGRSIMARSCGSAGTAPHSLPFQGRMRRTPIGPSQGSSVKSSSRLGRGTAGRGIHRSRACARTRLPSSVLQFRLVMRNRLHRQQPGWARRPACCCGARLKADADDLFEIRHDMMKIPEITRSRFMNRRPCCFTSECAELLPPPRPCEPLTQNGPPLAPC